MSINILYNKESIKQEVALPVDAVKRYLLMSTKYWATNRALYRASQQTVMVI